VMVGTTSPDYVAPNTAVVVQNKVGAKNAGTFDVDCACAAFPAQIAIAAGLLAAMRRARGFTAACASSAASSASCGR
jgi:3-oxoacyl-[acyl-carrier-protein] synthase III